MPTWPAKSEKLVARLAMRPTMSSVIRPSPGMSRVKKIKPGRRTLTAYSCPAMVRMLPRLARRMVMIPLHDGDKDFVQRGRRPLKAVQRQPALHNLLQQLARLHLRRQRHPLAAIRLADREHARPILHGLGRADLDGVGREA